MTRGCSSGPRDPRLKRRTLRQPEGAQPDSTKSGEVHSGERFWIAHGADAGTSWQIDDQPASLMAILDRIHGAHYHWVIEQTMNALNDAAPADDQPVADPDGEALVPIEIHQLMLEVLRLAHASDALEAQLPAVLKTTQTTDLPLRDRAFIKLAS
jgi:hypothetical protein